MDTWSHHHLVSLSTNRSFRKWCLKLHHWKGLTPGTEESQLDVDQACKTLLSWKSDRRTCVTIHFTLWAPSWCSLFWKELRARLWSQTTWLNSGSTTPSWCLWESQTVKIRASPHRLAIEIKWDNVCESRTVPTGAWPLFLLLLLVLLVELIFITRMSLT